MDRFYLLDASFCPSVNQGRNPIFSSSPERAVASQMTAFTAALQTCAGRSFHRYDALHDFSVREYRTFWRCFLQWSQGLAWSGSPDPVCVGDDCEHARFFPNLLLNYADNLLGLEVAGPDAPALTACHADGRRERLSRGELRERVARTAHALSQLGLREGDRVVAVMRNDAEAIVAALAVTALGATLSTAAAEMSAETLLDRFAPLAPRLLLAHTAQRAFDTGIPLADNVAKLAAALPSLQGIIQLDDGGLPASVSQPVHTLADLIGRGDAQQFSFQRFAFNHPLFIMFSSGTTGKPKCIVHGAGGTLLEHLKEHRLHSDLRPGDRMYFHTTCAWMMWNWQLSALASGTEIVTYDGPIATVDALWRLVADERVTVFGTSPAYLKMCEDAGLVPGQQFDLGALRAMMSTGSVLFDAQFEWVRDHVKALPLQSISGGTDILGCFVLGNPNLPVYAGEAQCKSLALGVQAWEHGAPTSGIGDLVCTNPFPSRPLGFYGDANGEAFHKAYFSANAGVWTHGDRIEFPPEGTARLHGRSDGVLNVRGINVGPGEIYRVLRDIPEIREAMVVEQRARTAPPDRTHAERYEQRMVLLLVLQDGVALTGALAARVRRDLARRASPTHVPDRILAVPALPATHNGKLSEAAARNAVNGLPVGNAAALRNPECLDAIRNHPALNLAARELPAPGSSREQLERHLQALWERLFDFAPIGRDDNFFDLGGHSLLAARLLADVHQSTGRTIPLATLLFTPTIAGLAAAIDEAASPRLAPNLVPVRGGTGAPLFLVHGASGSVMECWGMVNALRTTRPVYGLQARGLDGEQPTQRRVEDMAASYIEQIRTLQPGGPYALAGYSFGGLVVFEMAQQLTRAGEQVELLCLLDTYVGEQFLPWRTWMHYCWNYPGWQWRKLRAVPAAQRLRYLRYALSRAAEGVGMRRGRLTCRPDAFTESLPPALRQVRETIGRAMTTYHPRPYHGGPVLYLRAAVRQQRGDPLTLWRRVALRGLTIAEVPCSHFDLVQEPNLQAVAAILDEGLAGT